MPTFVFAYRRTAGYAPSADTAADWQGWFASMGDQLADLGRPVAGRTAALGECDPSRTQLGGYSVVSAPDLDAAIAIAKGCPHLGHDGGIEVGELGEVPYATGDSPQPG
jgi:hypothetical protein